MCFLLMSYQRSKVLTGVRPQGLLNFRGLINPRYFENLSFTRIWLEHCQVLNLLKLLFSYKRSE